MEGMDETTILILLTIILAIGMVYAVIAIIIGLKEEWNKVRNHRTISRMLKDYEKRSNYWRGR